MATVRMKGFVDLHNGIGIQEIYADINDSSECVAQALKDGFRFVNKTDEAKYSNIVNEK